MDVDDLDFDLPDDLSQLKVDQPPAVNLAEWKGAIMLYPAYFDGRKSVAQGRRLPVNKAINTKIEADGVPLTCLHIAIACDKLKLTALIEEGKRYPRDYFGFGRVRVKFDKRSGHAGIKNKSQLIYALAEILPQVQQQQLDELKQFADDAPPATDPSRIPPLHAYTRPLDPELFQYARDPGVDMMMRYGYGVLPAKKAAVAGPATSKKSKKAK